MPKDEGLDEVPVESQEYAEKFNRMTQVFVKFADKNECIITPRGCDAYIDSFIELGSCSCDSSRKACPCKEAKDEIEDKGHCECLLFWKNYSTFYNWFEQKI